MFTMPTFLRLSPLALSVATAISLLLIGSAHSAGTPDPGNLVGEATLVIGVAKVTSVDGVVRAVDRGTTIRVGDRIETGAGGHVHLRFVDGGRLSLRPASRLQVENYSRSGDHPDLTSIKLRLDEGVVRSITGAWGEAARDRFRLNTPVAAIGVKGTDFVVKSDANNTQASVYTGAIILTPLASGCQTSLGPCQNGSEKLLSEDMKGQMLTLSRQQTSPQLVPAVDLLAQRARPTPADTSAKTVITLKADGALADNPVDKAMLGESLVVDVVAAANANTNAQHPVAVSPQLVWARVAAVAVDGDTISRSYIQARENARQGVMFNFSYGLFRDESGSATALLTSADTSASFRLNGATAQLQRLDGIGSTETVRVDKGTLNVDFARATYATQLSLSSVSMGANSLVSSGAITPNGLFKSQGAGAYTSGALSLDGKEAAYYFEKNVAAGQLTGITQWGR